MPTDPPPGRPRRATMEDVAARAGVSRALVSLVFRDLPGASEATRLRVREAAAAIGYSPDQRARLLSRRTSGLIGVQFNVEHPFHGELVEALYTAAERQGYELALSAVAPSRREDRAVESLLSYRCEALLLIGPTQPAAALERLGGAVPVVVVARRLRSGSLGSVRTDDRHGAAQATEHLLGLGHVRVAHIDGGDAPGAAERRRGYRQAMERAGLAAEVQVLPGGGTEEAGATAGARLLTAQRRPTAVLAFNDRCALGLLQGLGPAGLAVPRDLAVVGYDDSRLARLPWVDLTTVRQDVAVLADRAVAQAVARATGDGGPAAVVVPPQLVVRTSSGPPR